jgi:hypothetical protein
LGPQFADLRHEIVILPVNHLMDGPDVIFRTGSGSKLSSVGGKNLIGFEADQYDARTRSGWSRPTSVTGRRTPGTAFA